MANSGIVLDDDLDKLNDYMYQSLVKQFGKEEADKLVNSEDAKLDSDVVSLIDNAGTLEDYK